MRKILHKGTAVFILTATIFFSTSSNSIAQGFAVSEVRAGVFAHNIYGGFLPFTPARWSSEILIEDINVELLFTSPNNDFFRFIGSPRPNLGGTFSLAGKESMVHAALTWQLPIFDTPIFIEGSFGIAAHNGALNGATTPNKNLGCRVNFYESASIGYNIDKNLSAMITYEHTSNLDLCSQNDGLSNLGIRFGYSF